jgi:outer membrane protein with beta-barrel domain
MGCRIRTAVLATSLLVATAAAGQAQTRAVTVFGFGGGYSALRQLDNAGNADFKTGLDIGGGVGLQLDQRIELRATLTGAQSQLVNDGAATGVYLNRYYLSFDLKAQHPAARGVTPFGLLGFGAVLLHEKGTTGADKTQGFAHVGVGIAYAVRDFSVFVEGDGFAYSLSELSTGALRTYSQAQFDVSWIGGVSYRFPF